MKHINTLSSRFLVAGVLLLLFSGAQELSATSLVVGNCKSGGYPTIQQAINAAPLGATVQVCPGNYAEQITITRAVTLQGIIANNGDTVVIAAPIPIIINTTDLFGDPVCAQVLVTNSSGSVNISNIQVVGENFGAPGALFAGIYYQNSPGTISGVTSINHSGNSLGIGIFLEGGASNPTVTVQNSYVVSSDYAGIDFETVNQPNAALRARITNNFVEVPRGTTTPAGGIQFGTGTTATVSGNTVTGAGVNDNCIIIGPGASGSVSGNTVTTCYDGIDDSADAVSVTSNKVLDNQRTGIYVTTSSGAVKSNIIMGGSLLGGNGVGLNFSCNSNLNVLSNTISYVYGGLVNVPTSLSTSTNKVFNSGAIRDKGICN